MISGYIDFDVRDIELIKTIFGDKISEIHKANFPGCHARIRGRVFEYQFRYPIFTSAPPGIYIPVISVLHLQE
jgi:hypothetical protein